VRDPDKYRTIEINRMLWRVLKGDIHVGQVRKGMDNLWYAEVGGGDRTRTEAVQRVVIANEAVEQFQELVDGNG
jgi:hypothetical protein